MAKVKDRAVFGDRVSGGLVVNILGGGGRVADVVVNIPEENEEWQTWWWWWWWWWWERVAVNDGETDVSMLNLLDAPARLTGSSLLITRCLSPTVSLVLRLGGATCAGGEDADNGDICSAEI